MTATDAALAIADDRDEAAPPCWVDDTGVVRWALGPLQDRCGLTKTWMAWHLHVSGETLRRAELDGLSDREADLWATRLGLEPARVWGWAWVDAALDPAVALEHTTGLERVTQSLRERIDRRQLLPGAVLPANRHLAAELDVSRQTVERAIRALAREGRIIAGGRGLPARVAGPDTATVCARCRQQIGDVDDQHHPHTAACTARHLRGGDCTCRHPAVHAACCPDCHPDGEVAG